MRAIVSHHGCPRLSPATPQFGTAEYIGTSIPDHCSFCKLPIVGSYYRVNAAMACESCASNARRAVAADSHAAFVRAIVFGVGAAIVGMVLYALVEIVTHFTIGYMALGVGYIIGAAMLKGSGGIGGRRYQIASVILTYAAVSLAAVPVTIAQIREIRKARLEKLQAAQQPTPSSESQASAERDAPTPQVRLKPIQWSALLPRLAYYGLASPIFDLKHDGFSGVIGLIILMVGIRIAWRMTAGRPLQVMGPFESAKPLASARLIP